MVNLRCKFLIKGLDVCRFTVICIQMQIWKANAILFTYSLNHYYVCLNDDSDEWNIMHKLCHNKICMDIHGWTNTTSLREYYMGVCVNNTYSIGRAHQEHTYL